MNSKHRFVAVLSLAAVLSACTATGAGASATLPIAVAPPPASVIVPPASPSTASSTGPTASPDASGAQATPGSIDPCTLLTQAEASTLMGKTLSAGVSTTLGPDRVCTFKSSPSEVKVFLTPPATDAAAANAFYDEARSSVPAGVVVDDISIPPFARAGYGSGGAKVPVSGLVVVDGNVGFEVYCGFPACGETASATAATLIGGRLP